MAMDDSSYTAVYMVVMRRCSDDVIFLFVLLEAGTCG